MKILTLEDYQKAGETFWPKYWYVAQACMGLNVSLDEVIEMNVDKLKARYPGGEFDVHHSENRVEGDV